MVIGLKILNQPISRALPLPLHAGSLHPRSLPWVLLVQGRSQSFAPSATRDPTIPALSSLLGSVPKHTVTPTHLIKFPTQPCWSCKPPDSKGKRDQESLRSQCPVFPQQSTLHTWISPGFLVTLLRVTWWAQSGFQIQLRFHRAGCQGLVPQLQASIWRGS